jgi:N-acyl-L-homoserine lactone synthetase
VAIERLSQRWGLTMHRMGPPQRLDGYLLVAGQIEFDAKTIEALAPVTDAVVTAPAWQIAAAAPQTTVALPLWAATEARVPMLA